MERQFNGQQKKGQKDYPRRLIPTERHEITVLSLFDNNNNNNDNNNNKKVLHLIFLSFFLLAIELSFHRITITASVM
jgi:hypothetical protein